jgi:8-oxo-dGDP phosphatase
MENDPYTRLSFRELYRNPWLSIESHGIVHPNGSGGEHVLIATPQSCGVVVEDRGEVLFTRQPRFAARRHVVEIVKGGRHLSESPLESAKRELREELGITAHRWLELGKLHEIPSIVAPPVIIFLASELEFGAAEPEDEESISLVRLKTSAALDATLAGEIDDAVTVAALFRFAAARGYISRRL